MPEKIRGCIITILLGIAGAFVGTGSVVILPAEITSPVDHVGVGAMILLLLYRFLFKRGA
jgi:uncharacterized membrane protein YeaQ/YmgE (transglycosylase-associated protein family)